MKRFATLLAAMALSLGVAPVAHAGDVTICTYDPAGKAGEYYKIMDEYALAAAGWGANVTIQAYTDEETAAKDYEAGKCNGVVATGVRLQRFNRFPSTIEAIGALPTYDHLHQMVESFAKYESVAKYLRSGEHETVGFLPAGAVYMFVRDREINSVAELAGKRIATMDYDKAAPVMVDRVGAIMVPADLGSIGPKFNNGDVDACYISAPAYGPFELGRGLGENGGIIKTPIAMATLQVLIHHEDFPADFGAKSRIWFAGQFKDARALVEKAEADIPSKYWVEVEGADSFDDMFLSVRLDLRDTHKAYDAKMLNVMAKVRCGIDSSRPECVEKKE